jgi:hypothetical protein
MFSDRGGRVTEHAVGCQTSRRPSRRSTTLHRSGDSLIYAERGLLIAQFGLLSRSHGGVVGRARLIFREPEQWPHWARQLLESDGNATCITLAFKPHAGGALPATHNCEVVTNEPASPRIGPASGTNILRYE